MQKRIAGFISRSNRRPLLIVCAMIAVGLGFTTFRESVILGTLRLSRMHAQIETDIQRIREENAYYKQEVDDLRYNRNRIEMEARKIGFMYPDEVAVYWKLDNGTTSRAFWRPVK